MYINTLLLELLSFFPFNKQHPYIVVISSPVFRKHSYIFISTGWEVKMTQKCGKYYGNDKKTDRMSKRKGIRKMEMSVRGGVKKKTCTFGWSRPQNGGPPPSPSSGQSTSFFCRKIFLCLQSPETEKKLSDLKVKFLPPPPSQPQLCQIFPLDESN